MHLKGTRCLRAIPVPACSSMLTNHAECVCFHTLSSVVQVHTYTQHISPPPRTMASRNRRGSRALLTKRQPTGASQQSSCPRSTRHRRSIHVSDYLDDAGKARTSCGGVCRGRRGVVIVSALGSRDVRTEDDDQEAVSHLGDEVQDHCQGHLLRQAQSTRALRQGVHHTLEWRHYHETCTISARSRFAAHVHPCGPCMACGNAHFMCLRTRC
jgi:hypothetical protein